MGASAIMTRTIQLSSQQEETLAQAEKLINLLTFAEEQVARLAASGLCAKELASRLGKSQKIVEHLIESIATKARGVYGFQMTFRGHVVAELRCFYFLTITQT
jgi:DNA-binding NarL/FixJ family response regulator